MADIPPQQDPRHDSGEDPRLDATDRDAAKLAIMGQVSLFVDVLLICGCVYLLTSDAMSALSGMPEFANRGGAFLVNLSATFALVHRSMALVQRFSAASSMATWALVVKWVVLLLVPLGVAAVIERSVQAGHRAQLDKLVEDITARATNAIANNAQVRASDMHGLQGPSLSGLTLRSDTGDFVLHAQVPAFDADGYSARFSSTERHWHLQPLGSPVQGELPFDANGPVLDCAMQAPLKQTDKTFARVGEQARGWRCEQRQP